MRCALVFVYTILILSANVSAKVFETRCKLARELIRVGLQNDSFLGQWVCLIEKESDRDTALYTEKSGGRKFYGLYQIPHKWCRPGKIGGDCNMKCESLLDDNIEDDTQCAQLIFHLEGFKYWPKWVTRCKNDYFITREIYKCPGLSRQTVNEEQFGSLIKRKQEVRISMDRYRSNVMDNVLRIRQPIHA